jgi:hypothetical protein
LAIIATLKANGAAVEFHTKEFTITGIGRVTHEHVAALDRGNGLHWVGAEAKEWFYSSAVVEAVGQAARAGGYSDDDVHKYLLALPTAYYRDEFLHIYESSETYRGKWNWAAFLFGGFWAALRGLWHVVAVWLAVVLLIKMVTDGAVTTLVDPRTGTVTTTYDAIRPILQTTAVLGLGAWIGLRGNFMLYSKQVKEKYVFF